MDRYISPTKKRIAFIFGIPLLIQIALADTNTPSQFPSTTQTNTTSLPPNQAIPITYQKQPLFKPNQYNTIPFAPYYANPIVYNTPPFNYQSPQWQLSQMNPMGNTFSPTQLLTQQPIIPNSPWGNSNTWFNPWKTWNNKGVPFFPAYQYQAPNKKKPWGDIRNIWPDFYTDFTSEAWDYMINAPYDVGRMPGGWRAPSLSSPDPVTVGDAITNQFPPILEEMSNMTNFSN